MVPSAPPEHGSASSRYLDDHEARRPYLDRVNSTDTGEILKGDHSFKITKMIRLGAVQFAAALYSVTNEYNEIVQQAFVPTKGVPDLIPTWKLLARRYEARGLKGPKVFASDQPAEERATLVSIFPSLKEGVRPQTRCPQLQLPKGCHAMWST